MEDLAQRKADLRRRLEVRRAKSEGVAHAPAEDIDAVVSRETLEKIERSKGQAKEVAALAKEKGGVVAGIAKEHAVALSRKARSSAGTFIDLLNDKRPTLPRVTRRQVIWTTLVSGAVVLAALAATHGPGYVVQPMPRTGEKTKPAASVEVKTVNASVPVPPPNPGVREVAPAAPLQQADTTEVATEATVPQSTGREQEARVTVTTQTTPVPQQKPRSQGALPKNTQRAPAQKPAPKEKDWRDEANDDLDKFMESQT
jgi:predicted secreted protein